MSDQTADNKKNRPTPKRKEAEAARKVNALAPATTKEGRKRQKELSRSARAESRLAYMRGDENALPARDRGPVKRWVRNYIDSRRTIGEYFMPLIFGVLILTVIPNKYVQLMAIFSMYLVMLYTFVSGFFMTRKIRKEVEKRFPGESTKGVGMYGFLRSTQMRRMRAPSPQVKRGDSI
jgi:hypothetical protein